MATALIQAKVDAKMKSSSEKIFRGLGLDMSTAIRMFLVKVNQTQSIPFFIGMEQQSPKLSNEFTDYLLNAEKDIQNDENILRFKDNAAGFEYLEKLMQ